MKKWHQALEPLLKTYGGTGKVPEPEARPVARAFFDEEVYPRFQDLYSRVTQAGYEAVLWPSSPPPEGSSWHLEQVALSVFRNSQSRTEEAPLARVEVSYRINLLCDCETRTKEGRTNVGVFTLAGEPLVHIESLIAGIGENLGLSDPRDIV